MSPSVLQSILIIAICTLCTFAERLLPFLFFRKGKVPPVVRALGRSLPTAVILTLVVYCLRGIRFEQPVLFLPQLAGVAITALLHLWKGNMLVSVVGGTACCMILMRLL